jgi:fructose-1,6-bisphosphatase/inositol monophosphatase family enzyme
LTTLKRFFCSVNSAYIKKVCRKAIIVGGKGLADRYRREVTLAHDQHAAASAAALHCHQEMLAVLEAMIQFDRVERHELVTRLLVDQDEILIVPLDGREGYVFGHPNFSVGITNLHNGEAIFAGVFNPFYNELFFSESGKGVKRNNTSTQVNHIDMLRKSFLGLSFRGHYDQNGLDQLARMFEIMRTPVRTMIPGSDLYGLSMVANGNLSAMVLATPNFPAVYPGLKLIEAAGGKVTDAVGNAPSETSSFILASNGRVHNELVSVFGPINADAAQPAIG